MVDTVTTQTRNSSDSSKVHLFFLAHKQIFFGIYREFCTRIQITCFGIIQLICIGYNFIIRIINMNIKLSLLTSLYAFTLYLSCILTNLSRQLSSLSVIIYSRFAHPTSTTADKTTALTVHVIFSKTLRLHIHLMRAEPS